jgi:hypothetical protein
MLTQFQTIKEAYDALDKDSIGRVFRSSSSVFITTAFGTGTFPVKEWQDYVDSKVEKNVTSNSKIRTSPCFPGS